jgi:Ca2+-binding EF-hand superfamily protein
MLSDEQRANIATIFDALDATEDGLITREDALRRADQLCTGLALDEESPAHSDIQSAYCQLWDELMRFADADADGAVNLDEFLDAVDRGMLEDPGFVDSAMLVVSNACFSAADRNGDGAIDRDEYASLFTAIDPSKNELASAGFDILDRDGDGLVSRAELIDAMRDVFYSSEPPDTVGARVLR